MLGFAIIGCLMLSLLSCDFRSKTSCPANLRMIDGAKEALTKDTGLTNGTPVTSGQLLPYLRKWPVCPSGGIYSVGQIGQDPVCSYPGHRHHKILPATTNQTTEVRSNHSIVHNGAEPYSQLQALAASLTCHQSTLPKKGWCGFGFYILPCPCSSCACE